MTSRFEHVRGLAQAIGVAGAANVLARRALGLCATVQSRAGRQMLNIRPTDSDLFVVAQIFGARQYEITEPYRSGLLALAREARAAGRVPLVVDAGANVGYSALYFSEFFLDAQILAIEPDPMTFKQLQANCASAARITPVHGALWRHSNGVDLQRQDSASWARSVVEGGLTPSMTLDALVSSVPGALPLVLKLDIEGAEREVVAASLGTVRHFPCILIEPHDFMSPGAGCLTPLFEALSGRRTDTLLSGENLMLYDSALVASAATS